MTDPAELRTEIERHARALGFDAVGVTAPDAIPEAAERLAAFLSAGEHGDMTWMADRPERRGSPRGLWPEVQSVIMLGMSYAPDHNPMEGLARSGNGLVSVYSRGVDYHDVIKPRLKEIASALTRRAGGEVKVFVDTAPVMEKPLAAVAGLGWQGKHSVLVSRKHGSWLFLGAIFTTLEIARDVAHADRCGTCRRCLDICPTDAFPAPYRLDARRCISYLTIEHKGPIPREFRAAMGNRIYGCDDCLAVCPWNSFAGVARESKLAARTDIGERPLAELLALDDGAFRALFARTPVKRTGRDRFLRNVLIAAGNAADAALVEPVRRLLDDPHPLVRGAAVWALSRLDAVAFAAERGRRADETAAEVITEWDEASRDAGHPPQFRSPPRTPGGEMPVRPMSATGKTRP